MIEMTSWFPSHIKPVHVGWYQVGHNEQVHHRSKHFLTGKRRFWDGNTWRAGWLNEKVSIFGAHKTHQWRGVNQECYFAITGVEV